MFSLILSSPFPYGSSFIFLLGKKAGTGGHEVGFPSWSWNKKQLRGAQELAASSQQKAALLGEELASAAGARDRIICMQVRKQQLELDMEQQTGSK